MFLLASSYLRFRSTKEGCGAKVKKEEIWFRKESDGKRKGETKVCPTRGQNGGEIPVMCSCAKWRFLAQNFV